MAIDGKALAAGTSMSTLNVSTTYNAIAGSLGPNHSISGSYIWSVNGTLTLAYRSSELDEFAYTYSP